MPSSIRIGNQHLTVDVSSLGAEMQALATIDGLSWLWKGDAAYWTGRSPILFPIVGSLAGVIVGAIVTEIIVQLVSRRAPQNKGALPP